MVAMFKKERADHFLGCDELSLGEECDLGGCFFALAGSGDLSARGRFGQARDYARELTVTRVTRLERVRRATDLASLNAISCPE